MSTNANAIGRKFIFALFHVQSNPAEPWTAHAVGNGPGPTPRARQTKGTGARWSRPQGYCLLSRAIIQFPILLYIRPISSQCLLFCVMLPSGGHAGGKRQGLGTPRSRFPGRGRAGGTSDHPQGLRFKDSTSAPHSSAVFNSLTRPAKFMPPSPTGMRFQQAKEFLMYLWFLFLVRYFIPKLKIRNVESVLPRGSVSVTGSLNAISGLIYISECCDCHHHNIKSHFYLSHICATFSTNKSNCSESTSNLI